MDSKIVINHVMSRDIDSGIFNSIIGYFNQFSPKSFTHVVSIAPIDKAAVYHYHRPHLENKLRHNSVCTVHHDLNDPDPWHAKANFIPRYAEAGAIICLNSLQKQNLIEQGLPEDCLYIVPHGYNDDVLLKKIPRPLEAERKIILGIASRRYGRRVKGDVYLSELAKRLDPDYFDFLLVGVDRGISAVELQKLGYKAKFYERLPYKMFQRFYESIDILLMCSSHEGGPANIPEALATGTPIFSSKIGISADVITDGYNGLFLTLDPDTDAEKITRICVDQRSYLIRLVEGAQESVNLAMTWEQSIAANLAVYGQIINK